MVTESTIARPDDQVLRVILGLEERPKRTSEDRPSGDPENMSVWLLLRPSGEVHEVASVEGMAPKEPPQGFQQTFDGAVLP